MKPIVSTDFIRFLSFLVAAATFVSTLFLLGLLFVTARMWGKVEGIATYAGWIGDALLSTMRANPFEPGIWPRDWGRLMLQHYPLQLLLTAVVLFWPLLFPYSKRLLKLSLVVIFLGSTLLVATACPYSPCGEGGFGVIFGPFVAIPHAIAVSIVAYRREKATREALWHGLLYGVLVAAAVGGTSVLFG